MVAGGNCSGKSAPVASLAISPWQVCRIACWSDIAPSLPDVPDGDVLIGTWWETAVWMHAMPAAKGRKVHLIQGYEVWWGGPADHARVHDALRLPNRKIAISTGLKREIEDALGDLGIEVVNNAVDQVQFSAPERERGTPPTVGFIYANDPIKGCLLYTSPSPRDS